MKVFSNMWTRFIRLIGLKPKVLPAVTPERQREIVDEYLTKHPEAWDGIERATFAYHMNHREADAHYFSGGQREARCRWCAQSREEVRHGDDPPQCQKRPEWANESIESVVRKEEEMFRGLFEKAKAVAEKINFSETTGEELSRLHHTHGIDPSMLECALIEQGRTPIPQELHDAYQKAYAVHRETGKEGLIKHVLIAKIAPDERKILEGGE